MVRWMIGCFAKRCNRVYRLEIQSVMLVFLTHLVNCCPSTFSLTSPIPPPFPKSIYIIYRQCVAVGGEGAEGVLSCVVDYILQEFSTLFLTRFRTYKIATPPQTKTPFKTTFRDWCLHSSFVHGVAYEGGWGQICWVKEQESNLPNVHIWWVH
jgi:hypothetical protein